MRSLLTCLVFVGFCQCASAGEITSVYTDLVPEKDCLTYAEAGENDGDWADLACSGYLGYPVLLSYGDARESVFFGFPPEDMTTTWESFSGFNSSGSKVEWRVEKTGNVSTPFAAIHRRSVSTSGEDAEKQTDVLVVAKVAQMEGREGCTVALVAASGNPNANEEARKIADEKARSFACGKDKRVMVGDVPPFGRVDN